MIDALESLIKLSVENYVISSKNGISAYLANHFYGSFRTNWYWKRISLITFRSDILQKEHQRKFNT